MVCAMAFMALAGCVGDGSPRPTTPTYTGNQRADPTRPPRPDAPVPGTVFTNPFSQDRGAYMPRHVDRRDQGDLKRVAVLLPFTAENAPVRDLAEGLFNAIQMSLFEIGAEDVVLVPKDASGDPASVAALTDEAIREGAVAIIGPVFSQQVSAVTNAAAVGGAPVLSFSTDPSAAGQGAYLVSLTPVAEVDRIVEWANTQGVTRYALMAPNSTYGRAVEQALQNSTGRRGGIVIGSEFYPPGTTTPTENARRLAAVVKRESEVYPGQVAVVIPERGVQLRSVASLLPYYDVDLREVMFLGTGAWNDPSVWGEASLFGGAFAAPDPTAVADFKLRYEALFGKAPPQLSSYGYDAGALAATLASVDRLDRATVEREDGWQGVNGLFRFLPDGNAQRALAVMKVQTNGTVRMVAPAPGAFVPGS